MGSKARALARLCGAGFRVPPFFVVEPDTTLETTALVRQCAALAPEDPQARFAVRSSAEVEDGPHASFAGMFETYLFVDRREVADRIERVRTSATAARVDAYAAHLGTAAGTRPSAIVQVMVDADVSGVAFGRDPLDGSDCVVIAAAYGLGSGIVGGDCDTDTYRVARDFTIAARAIATKSQAHRRAEVPSGTAARSVDEGLASLPALDDDRLREIAANVQQIGALFGAAQDVEWAIADGALTILQARPVTTPPGVLWDNSNISESYGGVVSPLTFSFARHAYAGAYRQFLGVLGIGATRIAAENETLENMLGLIEGRMYYNLLNWYHLLSLLPGFRLNRRFMEQMMGVAEALPAATVAEVARTSRSGDVTAVLRTVASLLVRGWRLPADVVRFHAHLDAVLATQPDLTALDLRGLGAAFDRLEQQLLGHWQAPLTNDFFAMIAYGVLRRATTAWCADGDGSLHNDLLCAEGGMISAEPAARMTALADLVRGDAQLGAVLAGADAVTAEAALAGRPEIASRYAAYLARFGDRCQGELKLESPTLHDDPLPLLRGIARLALAPPLERAGGGAPALRAGAEERVERALRARPFRHLIFRFVLAQARARIRDRENLRFERTRVFGQVRRIFLAIGRRLHAAGHLADPLDVFFLELEEIRAAIVTPELRALLRVRVDERREAYAGFAQRPAPPSRFHSIGATAPPAAQTQPLPPGDLRQGIGCCPGTIRARVRIVANPQAPLQLGEILVAEHTDPGWIVLFPAAAGILVERGSLLSHAAIVSREMGIPSVVAIPGLTRWLHDGDLVEFDGRSGSVRRLGPLDEIGSSTDATDGAAGLRSGHGNAVPLDVTSHPLRPVLGRR